MENPKLSMRVLLAAVLLVLSSVSAGTGQNLSRYRGFQLGATPEEIMSGAKLTAADLQVMHTHPALHQELEWNTRRLSEDHPDSESIRQIRFSFYNGALYKMAIFYDYLLTEGLTAEDIIAAISAEYGVATVPEMPRMVSTSSSAYLRENHPVLALWENQEYSRSLFRAYAGSFGLVITSKVQDRLAIESAAESVARTRSEAPQKELERRAQEEAERRSEQEKARSLNKPNFRP